MDLYLQSEVAFLLGQKRMMNRVCGTRKQKANCVVLSRGPFSILHLAYGAVSIPLDCSLANGLKSMKSFEQILTRQLPMHI